MTVGMATICGLTAILVAFSVVTIPYSAHAYVEVRSDGLYFDDKKVRIHAEC
jgi:hypothetical protein